LIAESVQKQIAKAGLRKIDVLKTGRRMSAPGLVERAFHAHTKIGPIGQLARHRAQVVASYALECVRQVMKMAVEL
jgi:hypothetical protein